MTLEKIMNYFFEDYETLEVKVNYVGCMPCATYHKHTKESFFRIYNNANTSKVISVCFEEYAFFKGEPTRKRDIPSLSINCVE